MSPYSTRYAAAKWEDAQATVLMEHGFSHGLANPCSFCFEDRSILVVVHGDDSLAHTPPNGA